MISNESCTKYRVLAASVALESASGCPRWTRFWPRYPKSFGNLTLLEIAELATLEETVTDLDLSDCGLTAAGVRNVCDFLSTNKSITRMIMWGNTIGDEGAKYIGDMLRVNKTLRILCINTYDEAPPIGPVGFSHLSDGLTHNDTLRELRVGSKNTGDEHVQKLCPGLILNRGLECLDLGPSRSITETGCGYLLQCLPGNVHLKCIKTSHFYPIWNKVSYWLALNRLNRKLIWDENFNHASRPRDPSRSGHQLHLASE
jgi:hypothetical protein